MKVGTITFHWANNYGAVLQAFALQQFLLKNGYDTEVLDYKPGKLYFHELIKEVLTARDKLKKRRKIHKFVRKNIRVSHKKAYKSRTISKLNNYDTVVCGSDQIWNEWLLFHAEKEPCLAYYLGTLPDNIKKISYAASFGTNILTDKTKEIVGPVLSNFRGVSVRENTAIDMLKDIHLSATRVCDPTLLLGADDYKALFDNSTVQRKKVFPFILHKGQTNANDVVKYVKKKLNDISDSDQILSVPEWLSSIANCDIVVTNSFHATVFSILFHKNFIVLPVDGKNMNDRITTLLETVGLSNRFCKNSEDIDFCIIDEADWETVDKCVDEIRKDSSAWLLNCIET